jgi:hypothetical protein
MIKTTAFVVFVALSSTALAQIPGFGKPSTSGGVTAEQLVKDYSIADIAVLTGQARMLTALGKKEQAAKLEAQAAALSSGATKDGLSDSKTLQGESAKEWEDGMKAQNGKLDAEGKTKYAEGLGFLGLGVQKYVALKTSISSYKPSLTSVGPSATAASYIVSTAPQQVSNLTGTLQKAVQFARSNEIPIPADATAALKF